MKKLQVNTEEAKDEIRKDQIESNKILLKAQIEKTETEECAKLKVVDEA